MKEKNIIPELDSVKCLLLMGVVLIHCDLNNALPVDDLLYDGWSSELIRFISQKVMRVCVPSFFIISGFLFFRNMHFNLDSYVAKLKSRIHTLLVPYILWNLIACILFLLKAKFLGFNGYNILVDGQIHWGPMLEGFIMIPANNNMPFAFAFWFIRDLMIFIVLAPLFWIFGRNYILFACVFATFIFIDFPLGNAACFLLGSTMGIHGANLLKLRMSRKIAILAVVIYFASLIYQPVNILLLDELIAYAGILAGFLVFWLLGWKLYLCRDSWFKRNWIESTFFIYAMHQLYCSVSAKGWVYINKMAGDTSIGLFLAYIGDFITLTGVSFLIYLFMRRCFPRITALLTGNRSSKC